MSKILYDLFVLKLFKQNAEEFLFIMNETISGCKKIHIQLLA